MSRVTESRFLSNMASVSMHITRTNMVPTMATYQSSSVVVFTFITCGHIRPWKRKRITPLSKENGSYCTYCHKAKSKHLMNHGMNMALRPLHISNLPLHPPCSRRPLLLLLLLPLLLRSRSSAVSHGSQHPCSILRASLDAHERSQHRACVPAAGRD